MSTDCEHDWRFIGIVYSYKADPRPGSSAVDRIYEHHYCCAKCLQQHYKNAREYGYSYTNPIEEAMTAESNVKSFKHVESRNENES